MTPSFFRLLMTVAIPLAMLAGSAQAQYPGDNAVWNASAVTYSHAFIDLTGVNGTSGHSDVCAKINAALLNLANTTTYPQYGGQGVIDARGISVSSACSMSPWGGTAPTGGWPPATILLPPGVISIDTTWFLPSGTRLVGEGSSIAGASITSIQAEAGFTGWMIQMGSTATGFCPTGGCTSVSVEDLVLDGSKVTSGTVNGIGNSEAADFSYVKRVTLYDLSGAGLQVFGSGLNSGPYTEITFDDSTSSNVSASTTMCAAFRVSTRGVRGIRCLSNGVPKSAIQLDSSNNSIEDVYIQGFIDGILVGENVNAQSDILANITGSSVTGGSLTNVVHIASNGHTVSDLSLMAISGSGTFSHSIQDDLTGANITDASVALYALGESQTFGTITAYPRFTTSASVPSWGAGPSAPSGSCTNTGSMFSVAGSSANNLYVCNGTSGWHPL
jgi:hypothetical protein